MYFDVPVDEMEGEEAKEMDEEGEKGAAAETQAAVPAIKKPQRYVSLPLI